MVVHLRNPTRSNDSSEGSQTGRLKIYMKTLPLEALQTFLERSLPDISLSGNISVYLDGSWTADKQSKFQQLTARITVADLVCRAQLFDHDPMKLAHQETVCPLVQDEDSARIEDLRMMSDLGQIKALGTFSWDHVNVTEIATRLAHST